jgi:hypothetical protein
MQTRSVFEQYLDEGAEYILPVGTELDFSMNSDSIYGETGYGFESDQIELHVFPDHNRMALYVDEDAALPTVQDEELIEYAQSLASNWRDERFDPWKDRVFETRSLEPNYGLD